MHHKDIKLTIRKQLKRQHPNWKRLTKKTKKATARKVLAEVSAEYDFNQDIRAPREELLGIEQQIPTEGIIKLDEMARFIHMINSSKLIKFNSYNRSPIYIKDAELRFVDELLDDGIINRLLAQKGVKSLIDLSLNIRRSVTVNSVRKNILAWIGSRTVCLSDYR